MADETGEDKSSEFAGAAGPDRGPGESPVQEGEIAAPAEPAVVPAVDSVAAASSAREPRVWTARSLASAAIGALVGAGVAAGALWWAGRQVEADFAARIDRAEKNASASSALEKRIVSLERSAAQAPDKASLEAHGQRISALESAALNAKAAADANSGALAMAEAARADAAKALTLALSAEKPSAESPAQPGSQGDEAALAERIGKVEAMLAALDRPPPEQGALTERIAKAEAKLAALDRPPVDLAPLEERLGKMERALNEAASQSRAGAQSLARSDASALAVVAEALSERFGSGAPFAAELAALDHLGADPARTAALKPFAEKGAPSAIELAADFAKAAPAALATASSKEADGVVDRLMANMRRIVRVTPIGAVAGDDPPALISQIEAALRRGDIRIALSTWERLPEPARQALRDWAEAAKARLAAEGAAQALVDDAMKRLAATAP